MSFLKKNIAITFTIIVLLILSLFEPLIFTAGNLVNISKQAALIAIFALSQSVVLITKGLDLSQGGVVTVISVSVALICTNLGLPLAIIVGLCCGCLLGGLNGLLISAFDISPLVVTLGTGFLFQGVALVLSNGQPVFNVTDNFSYLGWGTFVGVPIILIALLILVSLLYIFLTRMTFGRFFYAVGSNEIAAKYSGISVPLIKICAYGLSGFITAIGAIILASRINGGHPIEGINTPLQSVAAAVIGGVSLFGGKGKVSGVLLGSLLLAFISNALSIINVSSYYQQIVIGIIIIFAIIVDKLNLNLKLNSHAK